MTFPKQRIEKLLKANYILIACIKGLALRVCTRHLSVVTRLQTGEAGFTCNFLLVQTAGAPAVREQGRVATDHGFSLPSTVQTLPFHKPPTSFSRLLRHPPLVLTVLPCITFHSFISSQTDKQQIDALDTMQLKLLAAALAGASSVAASADVKRTDKGEKPALHILNRV